MRDMSMSPVDDVDGAADSCMDLSKEKLRKMTKPLMEKRRRERINTCLNQLKSLVLEAMNQNNSQFSKLEKADILEMTVKHLKNMHRQHTTDQSSVHHQVARYRSGYVECAQEVARCLGGVKCVDDEVRMRLMGHLAQRVDGIPHSEGRGEGQVSPLYVRIPSTNIPPPVSRDLPTPGSQYLLSAAPLTNTHPTQMSNAHPTPMSTAHPAAMPHYNRSSMTPPSDVKNIYTSSGVSPCESQKMTSENAPMNPIRPVLRQGDTLSNIINQNMDVYRNFPVNMSQQQQQLAQLKPVSHFCNLSPDMKSVWRPW